MFERYYDAKVDAVGIPLHSINDREYWDKFRPFAKELLCDYPKELGLLTASKYMQFRVSGNRTGYETPYLDNRNRLCNLAAMEAVYNDGKFMSDIVDTVWCILDEFTWCLPAHNGWGGYGEADNLPDPDDYVLDIFQAETGALLAEVYYIFKEKFTEISKNIGKRIERELKKRVIEPFINREYNYMGFNKSISAAGIDNWNPWVVSNVLMVALVLGDGSVISKAAKTLDNYNAVINEDGGCDEGPEYWFKAGVKFIEASEYLRLLTGIDVTDNEKLKNCGEFNMKSNLFGNVFANFADNGPYIPWIGGYYAAAKITKNKGVYDFAHSVYEYNKKTGLDLSEKIIGRTDGLRTVIYNLEAIADFENNKCEFAHKDSYYVESIQIKSFHKGSFDVCIKAGHNDESHNHNDVGNYIITKYEECFIIDVGAMVYTRDTFSANRYNIWVNQSSYHNLPEIAGVSQKEGLTFEAREVKNLENGFSLDMARAYDDESILKWKRTMLVDEDRISITEDYEYEEEKEAILHLMTQFEPQKEEYGLSLKSKAGNMLEIHFDGEFSYEKIITKDDKKLSDRWGDCIYRINIPIEKAKSGKFGYTFK